MKVGYWNQAQYWIHLKHFLNSWKALPLRYWQDCVHDYFTYFHEYFFKNCQSYLIGRYFQILMDVDCRFHLIPHFQECSLGMHIIIPSPFWHKLFILFWNFHQMLWWYWKFIFLWELVKTFLYFNCCRFWTWL
jgi:hypothetical protein